VAPLSKARDDPTRLGVCQKGQGIGPDARHRSPHRCASFPKRNLVPHVDPPSQGAGSPGVAGETDTWLCRRTCTPQGGWQWRQLGERGGGRDTGTRGRFEHVPRRISE